MIDNARFNAAMEGLARVFAESERKLATLESWAKDESTTPEERADYAAEAEKWKVMLRERGWKDGDPPFQMPIRKV
jgi:hypothetical protein